jgi:hypothetical protein
MKNLIVITSFLLFAGLLSPAASYAEDSVQTCTTITQYGGSVSYICGSSTHAPVNTGLGENLALVGALTLASSGFLLFLAKRAKSTV